MDLGGLIDPATILNFAGMNDAAGWIGIGVSFFLNLLVGGIILVVILELLGHHWNEHVNPVNAFFAVFISSLITMLGGGVIAGMLGGLGVYGYYLFSLAVWFVLIKVFFRELATKHAAMAAGAVFVANIIVLPQIVFLIRSALGM